MFKSQIPVLATKLRTSYGQWPAVVYRTGSFCYHKPVRSPKSSSWVVSHFGSGLAAGECSSEENARSFCLLLERSLLFVNFDPLNIDKAQTDFIARAWKSFQVSW